MTEDTLQPFMEWIQTYPTWTGIIVCVISFSESLVGIGFFVPGVLLMTAIGALVGSGTLPLVGTLLWAILGAVIGDGVSFWVGHRYKEHLRDYWPFSRYPQWLNRGEAFFKEHGGTSIILGRFIGPIRPIIPVIAGIMNVKPLNFYCFNIASAIVWAPIYSLPGYLFGLSLGVLDAKVGKRLVLVIILFGILLWSATFGIKWFVRKATQMVDRYLDHLWSHCAKSDLCSWFIDKRHPQKRGQLAKAFLIILLMATLSWVHWTKALQGWQEIDGAFWQISESLHTGGLAVASQFFAQWSDPHILAAFVAASAVLFAIAKCGMVAIFFACIFVLGFASQAFLSDNLGQTFWMASPLWATLVYFGVALRIARDCPVRITWIPYSIASLFVVSTIFGELYLGTVLFSEMSLAVLYAIVILLILDFCFRNRTADPWYGAYPVALSIGLFVLCIGAGIGFWKKPFQGDMHRMSGGQIQVFNQVLWKKSALIEEGFLRYNFWGKPLVDFNVQIALPLETFTQGLIAQGWSILPSTSFLELLQWLSNEPKPEEHPDIPHFHQNKGDVVVLAKPHATGRYALRLWRTNYQLGQVPIFVGTVLSQEWRQPLPLIHVYTADEHYREAFVALEKDLKQFQLQSFTFAPFEQASSPKGWDWEMLLVSE